jgi:hypothetical protein
MKKQITSLLFTIVLTVFTVNGFCQVPPPPPTGAGHGATGNQNGGSAPIGGGLFILLGLGAAYGGKKLYKLFDENKEG